MTIRITTIQGQGLPLGSYQQAVVTNKDGTDYYEIIGKNHVYVPLTDAIPEDVPVTAVALANGILINPANAFLDKENNLISGEEYGARYVYSNGNTSGLSHSEAMAYNNWFTIYGDALTNVND